MRDDREGICVPASSVKKNAVPIPSGARYVARCFSTASMRITNTSCAVRNTSMNRPWEMDVPPPRTVSTAMGPGYIAETRPAAAMPAMSWEGKTRRARMGERPPQR
jgi:hypothetical protein